VREFFGKEPNRTINPDEVVAVGAAVQAAVLGGDPGAKGILLIDVTPLTLGVETLGGVMTPMITRNTAIPAKKSETYSTASDAQSQVEIHVLQGERPMASENKSLGRFILDGLPPSPRGVPQIEVTFDLDSNGILSVQARDKATGKEQKVTITASSGLSKDEIERMVRESEQHAEEDAKRRELIEARNIADNLVYNAEKSLRDLGEQVAADVRSEVEAKISDVREAMSGDDAARIRSAATSLTESVQKIGSAMYGQPGQPGTDGTGPQPQAQGAPEEGTVEGEFHEV
jgi:molecular chaperone DnaK